MRFLLILAGLAALVFACNDAADDKSAAAKPLKKTEKKYDGKKIFQKNCVQCHGVYGNSEINGAKNLQVSKLNREERIHIITNGKGVMTPYKDVLKPAQIEAVAEYTESLKQ